MKIKMRIAWWQFCFSNVKSFVTNIVTFLKIKASWICVCYKIDNVKKAASNIIDLKYK